MKIIYREFQQDIFKDLVEILKVLAKVHTEEATDAIVDAFDIACLVGVEKDLMRVAGLPDDEEDYKRWTDMLGFRHVMQKFM